jgi:hypothetical protein
MKAAAKCLPKEQNLIQKIMRCEGEEPMTQDQWFNIVGKQSDPDKLRLFPLPIISFTPQNLSSKIQPHDICLALQLLPKNQNQTSTQDIR